MSGSTVVSIIWEKKSKITRGRLTQLGVVFCFRRPKFLPIMNPLRAAFLALALFAASASAALWQSEDFDCSINLPDCQSSTKETNWTTLGSTEEGTLVGAGREDRSAFVFVGYVDLAKKKNFHLNPKTI